MTDQPTTPTERTRADLYKCRALAMLTQARSLRKMKKAWRKAAYAEAELFAAAHDSAAIWLARAAERGLQVEVLADLLRRARYEGELPDELMGEVDEMLAAWATQNAPNS